MLLIWAPRKPERFDAAAARMQAAGIPFLRRSRLSSDASMELPGVLLVDTMGELAGLFRLGNVVFMGGTFPHRGGHNPLEPAAFGVTVVAGPHMENFTEIAADFDAQRAWVRVEDPRELGGVLVRLLDDRERQRELGGRARALAEDRRGATARAVAVLREAYEDALPAPLAPLWQRLTLGPLAWVWRAGVWVDQGMKSPRRRRLCCVVSVGNLSVGGTGKTPFVVWLCARLREQGRTPGVLLRGYRRRSGPAVLTLAAGQSVPVETAGEEALIHLRAGYGPVGVGADRERVLIELQARYGIDCAVADDGFQHWRLRRDCDIVLIDALDPLGGGVLPLGRLREDFSALRRAHAVVVTRTVTGRSYAGLLREIGRWNAGMPVFFSRTVAGVDSLPAGAGAFCGLGNPEAFRLTLGQIRVASDASPESSNAAEFFQPAFFQVFEDHHRYTEVEIGAMLERAGVLVTTEKDWLNLPERFQRDGRVIVVPIRVVVDHGAELFNLVKARLLAAAARA
jgi:tetraacyldisaccharide 4'-kinase